MPPVASSFHQATPSQTSTSSNSSKRQTATSACVFLYNLCEGARHVLVPLSVCAYCALKAPEFTVAHLTADSAMLDEMHCLAYEIDPCLEFAPVEDYHDVTWLVEYTAVIDREK